MRPKRLKWKHFELGSYDVPEDLANEFTEVARKLHLETTVLGDFITFCKNREEMLYRVSEIRLALNNMNAWLDKIEKINDRSNSTGYQSSNYSCKDLVQIQEDTGL